MFGTEISGALQPRPGGKLEAALAWAARDLRVFPLRENSRFPLDLAWVTVATTDRAVIFNWWRDPVTGFERDLNVGFLCSDHVVLDVDVKNGKQGLRTFFDLGLEFGDTLTVRTPSGGYHVYFQKLLDRDVGSRHLVGPHDGVDVKSHNGYVVAPGSTIDGIAYAVEFDVLVTPFPEPLRHLLKSPRRRDPVALANDVEIDAPELIEIAAHWLRHEAPPAVEGRNGDDVTYKVACRIRDYGISEHVAFELFLDEYSPRCVPPWSDAEARKKVENAYRYATGEIGGRSPLAAFAHVVPVEAPDRKDTRALPATLNLYRADKSGRPILDLANVNVAMRTHNKFDVFAYDEMARQPVIQRPLPAPPAAGIDVNDFYPRPARDTDISRLQELLQRDGFSRLGRDIVHEAVKQRAEERMFHPVRDYLDGLHWDGQLRLDGWLTTYVGAEASAYTLAIGKMFLIAMVARIYKPGCQADYLLVFEGPQGAGKSTACRVLAGEWFSDSLPDLSGSEKDAAQHLRGKWIIEVAELAALGRADAERLKSFITRPVERFRPPYGRLEAVEPRHRVMIGSTNQSVYLRDETGGRRFWPVKVGRIDIAGLRRDRDQLFAEAVRAYRDDAPWWPDAAFEAQHIRPEQESRFEADAWEDDIVRWLEGHDRVQVSEVARHALGMMTAERISTSAQKRIGKILCKLGWRPVRDHRGRGYIKQTGEA